MSVNYKYLPKEYDGTPLKKLVGENNSPNIPGGIIDKLIIQYNQINGDEYDILKNGDMIYIPILPPFQKKFTNLLTEDGVKSHVPEKKLELKVKKPEPKPEPEPEPVEEKVEPPKTEPKIEKPEPVEKKVEPVKEDSETKKKAIEEIKRNALKFKYKKPIEDIRETKEYPKEEPKEIEVEETRIKSSGVLKYRTFPYTFSRSGETIEAVIRLYNDMSVSKPVLQKLVFEFSRVNPHANPPKLGQTVKVPVLMPFVFRHLNKNKIM